MALRITVIRDQRKPDQVVGRCPDCGRGLVGRNPRGAFTMSCPRCKQPLLVEWVDPSKPDATMSQ